MNVLYTCDNNYIWIMGISVISLFENNSKLGNITVYLLGENITEENKTILMEIGTKYSRQIIVLDVPELNIPESLTSLRWPLSAFTRLFSGDLLPLEIDKILYLDCDTIVSGNIEALYDVAFNDNIFLGVKDCIGRFYKENIGLDKNEIYINAGVLLINLQTLRKIDVKKKIEEYMNKYIHYINYADQDILNAVFRSYIGELDPRYNVMTIDFVYNYDEIQVLRKPTNFYQREIMEFAVNNPIITHYTTNMHVIRPWYKNTNHPRANEFFKYLHLSKWKDKALDQLVYNSKKDSLIKLINFFPRKFACYLLGVIHADLNPLYIKTKLKRD